MNKVRFAVLGASRIARKAVIPVLQQSDFAELVLVGTSSPEKASDIGAPVANYQEVLANPDVDAIYISLPNSMHEEWSIKALSAGKHVWCEKPAALSIESAHRMVDAAQKHGVRLMEGFMYRYHPQHRKVRELIDSGTIGDVTGIRARIAYPRPDSSNIRLDAKLGGGFYFDALVYPLNASRMLYQAEPVSAQCDMKFDPDTGVDVDDQLVLTFPDGRAAEILGAFTEDYRSTYEVQGSKGTIRMERAYAVPKDMAVRVYLETAAGTQEFLIEPYDHFVPMAKAFCEDILHSSHEHDFETELLRQAAVVDAGWRSAHEHRTIKIPVV